LRQVEEAKKFFPGADFEITTYDTLGDKDKTTPISEVEGSDFFTREIDQALLNEEIDLAVHSAKDLPDKLVKGLQVLLETKSISPLDALVSKGSLKFKALPQGSRIGASSKRRKGHIQLLRPDLAIIDVRGSIGERLSLLNDGKIDALIVAEVALIRLGLEERIAEVLLEEFFPAHPKQGSLSLVVKEKSWRKVKSLLSEQARATGN